MKNSSERVILVVQWVFSWIVRVEHIILPRSRIFLLNTSQDSVSKTGNKEYWSKSLQIFLQSTSLSGSNISDVYIYHWCLLLYLKLNFNLVENIVRSCCVVVIVAVLMLFLHCSYIVLTEFSYSLLQKHNFILAFFKKAVKYY